MFNIKLPIGLIVLLLITIIVNVFSNITIEYYGISVDIFRTYEVQCGNILSVINTTDISEFSQDLRVNWNTCQQKAYMVIITSTISIIFLISLLLYLIYLYKNKPARDDMSDLLGILKRINNK
jgi:hypothetical protein|tara:strand:- start:368 stop:736 length:369 start_codon:yes stop_codon:yes gene_type:complete